MSHNIGKKKNSKLVSISLVCKRPEAVVKSLGLNPNYILIKSYLIKKKKRKENQHNTHKNSKNRENKEGIDI